MRDHHRRYIPPIVKAHLRPRKLLPTAAEVSKVLCRLFDHEFGRQAYDVGKSAMLALMERRAMPQKFVAEVTVALRDHHDLSLIQHSDGSSTIWSDFRRAGRLLSLSREASEPVFCTFGVWFQGFGF